MVKYISSEEKKYFLNIFVPIVKFDSEIHLNLFQTPSNNCEGLQPQQSSNINVQVVECRRSQNPPEVKYLPP